MILVLRRLRLENLSSRPTLGYTEKACLRKVRQFKKSLSYPESFNVSKHREIAAFLRRVASFYLFLFKMSFACSLNSVGFWDLTPQNTAYFSFLTIDDKISLAIFFFFNNSWVVCTRIFEVLLQIKPHLHLAITIKHFLFLDFFFNLCVCLWKFMGTRCML